MDIPLALAACLAGIIVLSLLIFRSRQRAAAGRPIRWGCLALFVLLTFFIGVFGLVNGIAYMRADNLIHPSKSPARVSPESKGIIDYLDVAFTTPDRMKIAAWYLPPENGAVVIAVHGFASNRTQFLPEAALLQQAGFGVLLIDSRNAGGSSGDINTFGLYEVNDIRGAVTFLQGKPGVNPHAIGLLGHSQGGSTVIQAAAQLPETRAVLSQSTFSSLEDNVYSGVQHLLNLPPEVFAPLVIFWGERISGLDLQAIRPVDQIAAISPRPVLIMHGALDELIPVENAERLYAAAGEPKELYILPDAGHDRLLAYGKDAYAHKLIGFFQSALLSSP